MELFTAKQVASQLSITTYTVRKYVRLGRIPAFKLGKQWLFKKEDVELFIETLILKKGG